MRTIVYDLVEEALLPLDDWTADQIFNAGSIREDNLPPTPFAVIRFGVFSPGMAHIHDGSVDIWIHDEGADYSRIDAAMRAIYARMDGVEHVSEQDGSAELIRARWTAMSGDLFDPGFRTITKNSSYQLIGTGA